jgi:gas vesicle protein
MGKSSNAFRKIAVGAAVAGAAGYIAGVLSAPKEGKKTRKELKKTAELSVTEVEKQLKQLHSELGDMVGQAKDGSGDISDKMQKKFGGAVANAHSAKDKLREILSSVHEGQANDKDLQKALQDARRTLEHLKHFIKK